MSQRASPHTALVSAAITAAAIIGGPLAARTPAATPAAARSPFLGTWELDLARMPDTYGPPPKRVTYSFADAGAGQWLTRIDIAARDGGGRHVSIRLTRDGKAVPGEGDTVDEYAAAMSPNPNVLVMSLSRAKSLESVRTYTVSADGKEMIESAADVDPSGMPFVRLFHFRRIA